ncbi:MAG: hypothetical protein NZ954_01800 [Thermofilaceae archaeon]|nr:hypothetical protein [Thermofilaceae archaeon]MCX8180841.1 hypothetical protein [Thermofilaceae archaeon]MDW8003405.1 hypothetical protein [Thermofilaceae archaeon]
MPNITFRIEGIRAERYSFEQLPQLAVNMNIVLGKVEKSGQVYTTSFLIKLEYQPPVASIEVKGTAYVTPLNEEEKKELEKGAATGQPPPQLLASIYSYVLPLVALLTREVGLPPPVPLPIPPQQPEKQPTAPGYF